MPSVIDRIRSELDARGVTYEVSASAISVPASTSEGFRVTLVAPDDRRYEVRCEEWRERFDRAEDAYDCALLALSDRCRLRVVRRGAAAVEWQIERREYGMWAPGPRIKRLWAPFWRTARIEHLQNHVINS